MSINILFVDDEPNTINVVKLLVELEQPDWIFHAAYDGATALAIAGQTSLDFVLLDISMQGMDGIEVCKRLRQMPSAAQLPIVMLTALDTPERRTQSAAAGANDFWIKPFKPMTIVKDIAKIIEDHQA